MLKVGIHENVKIVSAGKYTTENKKKAISVELAASSAATGLDSLNESDEDNAGNGNTRLLFWPIDANKATNPDAEDVTADLVLGRIKTLKAPLDHILGVFFNKEDIKWDLFKGTIINDANKATTLLDNKNLEKVFDNIADQFTEMMKDVVTADPSQLVRIKLRRRSKPGSGAKMGHMPSVANRYLSNEPFMESMDVPKEMSKVKFSDYEVKEGFDSPEADAETADATAKEAYKKPNTEKKAPFGKKSI